MSPLPTDHGNQDEINGPSVDLPDTGSTANVMQSVANAIAGGDVDKLKELAASLGIVLPEDPTAPASSSIGDEPAGTAETVEAETSTATSPPVDLGAISQALDAASAAIQAARDLLG